MKIHTWENSKKCQQAISGDEGTGEGSDLVLLVIRHSLVPSYVMLLHTLSPCYKKFNGNKLSKNSRVIFF